MKRNLSIQIDSIMKDHGGIDINDLINLHMMVISGVSLNTIVMTAIIHENLTKEKIEIKRLFFLYMDTLSKALKQSVTQDKESMN